MFNPLCLPKSLLASPQEAVKSHDLPKLAASSQGPLDTAGTETGAMGLNRPKPEAVGGLCTSLLTRESQEVLRS